MIVKVEAIFFPVLVKECLIPKGRNGMDKTLLIQIEMYNFAFQHKGRIPNIHVHFNGIHFMKCKSNMFQSAPTFKADLKSFTFQ